MTSPSPHPPSLTRAISNTMNSNCSYISSYKSNLRLLLIVGVRNSGNLTSNIICCWCYGCSPYRIKFTSFWRKKESGNLHISWSETLTRILFCVEEVDTFLCECARITHQVGFGLGDFLGMSIVCYYTLELGLDRNRSNGNDGYLIFGLVHKDSYSLCTDFPCGYTLIQRE